MNVGERLTVTIEKPAAGGRMIARHGGAVVLVAGAIPGERVEVTIDRVQRGMAWGRTTAVLAASPDRVAVQDHWACGGNVLAHVAYDRQRALKRDIIRDAFTRIGKLPLASDVDVAASPESGYRMRARLHVVRGRIGFYREGTHDLCDPGQTGQLLPETLAALDALAEAFSRVTTAAAVTEVELAENRAADERALHLSVRDDSEASRLSSLPAICGVRGVSCGVGSGARPLVLWGMPKVTDTLSVAGPWGPTNVTLTRQAHSFFQGNRFLLGALINAVVTAVPAGRVLDLYAGVGLFSVAVAARGHEVIAVEGDRAAAYDLKLNAAQPLAGHIEARHQSVEALVKSRRLPHIDTVVVDPPRTGMTKDALRGVLALGAARLVYVSCDVATLARDSHVIVDRGYHLSSIRAFDLFPQTAHVETLVVFDREKPGAR